MSDELVTVPFGDNQSDKAVLLLAAAESQDLDPSVIRTDTQGVSQVFVVPKSVADEALSGEDAEGVEDYEDPWENVKSGETVSAYPQQGAEAEIGQDGSEGSEEAEESESDKAAKKAAAKKSTK